MTTTLTVHQDLGVEVTETSWQPERELTWDQMAGELLAIQRVGRSWKWWLGDALIYASDRWEQRYREAMDQTGLGYQMLRNIVWVASSVPLSVRTDKLTWSHHEAVASLGHDEQVRWLELAVETGLTVHQLEDAIKASMKPQKETQGEVVRESDDDETGIIPAGVTIAQLLGTLPELAVTPEPGTVIDLSIPVHGCSLTVHIAGE